MRLRCFGERRRAWCWRGCSPLSSSQPRTPPWPSAPRSDGRPPADAGSCPPPDFSGRRCVTRACARERESPGGQGERTRPRRTSAARGSPRPPSPGRLPLSLSASPRARAPCGARWADRPAARRVPAPPARPPPLRGRRAGPSGRRPPAGHASDAGQVHHAVEAPGEGAGATAPRRVQRGRRAGSAGGRPRRRAPGRRRAGRRRPRSRTRPRWAAARPRGRAAPHAPGRRARWGRAPLEGRASLEEAV